MPREKIVRGDRVVDALNDSPRPFVTTSDIADYLGVTAQAIRDNASELESHPDIEKGKVAQSSVYWLADSDPPEQVTDHTAGRGGFEETRPDPEPEPTEPDTTESETGTDSENESGGILDRLFAGDGMALPGVVLILLAVLLPLMALERTLDATIRRLEQTTVAYSDSRERVRIPWFGSPAGVWILTGAAAVVGLVVGVSVGIVILEPAPVVASYAITAVSAFAVAVSLLVGIHTWNTNPAVREIEAEQ